MKLIETFDINEISLIILNIVAYTAILLLPKILTKELALLSLVWGLTIGVLFDFTIGGGLLDYYKVNDTNHYELFDIFYYLLFVPFGYTFIYFYQVLNLNKKTSILYIIVWAFIGLGSQGVFTVLNIITLQNGYKIAYSLPVFLIIQTITAYYYEYIKNK